MNNSCPTAELCPVSRYVGVGGIGSGSFHCAVVGILAALRDQVM